MARKTAIVVTTIFEPRFLRGYVDNIRNNGRTDHVELIVIPDRKTPASVLAACVEARRGGINVSCPSLEEQEQFLRRFPGLASRIPYDSDNRRNAGFLLALDHQAEVIISIDDDNFCLAESDFIGEHAVVGQETEAPVLDSSDGWFNIGTMLEGAIKAPLFPRGFPYFARFVDREVRVSLPRRQTAAINAGLWIGDPDVDAVSRLALAPHVDRVATRSYFLGPHTWSPINTQNTAVSRQAMPAYYYTRMGYPVGGMTIDRYGDILSGYFSQKCVRARGEYIRIGSPVADHRRTPHNLFKDLAHELAGMVIIEDLLPWLRELSLDGASYAGLYRNLADELAKQADRFTGFLWDQGAGAFLRETAANMQAWLDAVADIG
ncbi:MAG TPA: hypothetical protein VJX67_16045 [Blastocatellia bacterium]|nr:hypothetical protein [Blastocatellia bacterium]